MKRVFLIVLDSVGMGEMPDAAEYGDALCKKEAEKMKAAAKDNWASFKNWVP